MIIKWIEQQSWMEKLIHETLKVAWNKTWMFPVEKNDFCWVEDSRRCHQMPVLAQKLIRVTDDDRGLSRLRIIWKTFEPFLIFFALESSVFLYLLTDVFLTDVTARASHDISSGGSLKGFMIVSLMAAI